MIIYQTVRENLWDPNIGEYTSFGISVRYINNESDHQITYVSDVFLEKTDADQFVSQCNSSNLDVIHLLDVIENSL